jgi:hypothetical protein
MPDAIDLEDDLVEVPLAGPGRSRRSFAANCVPNFATQIRIVSWETMTPRSARRSSTSRRLKAKR